VGGDLFAVALALAVDLTIWDGDRITRGGLVLPLWLIPALSVAVYAPLVRRKQQPVAVFALQWVYGLAALVVPGYVPFANLLVALHAVAHRCPVRRSSIAFAVCAIPFAVNSFDAASATRHGTFLGNFLVAMLLFFAAATCAWVLGRIGYRADRKARLAQQMQAEAAADAVRDERLRLARELHDIVAHSVTAMILQAAGARRLVDPAPQQVDQAFGVIESAGVQAMNELHRLLDLLRKDSHAEVEAATALQPGLEDLPDLVEFSRAAGIDIELTVSGRSGRLDRSVDLAAYRVIQEGLTNASKYGGRNVSVRIRCVWSDDRLTIVVKNIRKRADDAVEPAALSSGRGLIGLAERVSLVGGRLEAGPDGEAFLVRAELPVGNRTKCVEGVTEE
jgi:signal transduction histidine kinase